MGAAETNKRAVPHLRLSPKTSLVFLIGTLLRYDGMSFGPLRIPSPRRLFTLAELQRVGPRGARLTHGRAAHEAGLLRGEGEHPWELVEIKGNMGSADSRTGSF